MIVVDSNVLAARCLTGVRSPLAEKVEMTDRFWIAPPLWRNEFQNILAKSAWAQQLTQDNALRAWRIAADRMTENEHEPTPERVIEVACHHRITAYDANFIVLAMEMGVFCVTEDRDLRKKFPDVAMSMEDFIWRGNADGTVREFRAPYGKRKAASRRT